MVWWCYRKMSFKVEQCDCGSNQAVAYWNEKEQKFTCKYCVGYPRPEEEEKDG